MFDDAGAVMAYTVRGQSRLGNGVYLMMLASGEQKMLDTASAVLEGSASLEAAARLLFVHPNTVRYRLRRIAEVTGRTPTQPRDAFTLRMALTLGRLDERDRATL